MRINLKKKLLLMKWKNLNRTQTIDKVKFLKETIKSIENETLLTNNSNDLRNLLIDRLECEWDLELYYNNDLEAELFFDVKEK